MAGKFGMAFITWKPLATAFELDRDNVAFASIMGAPGFFIDIDANDLGAMNHHRDRSRLINLSRLRRAHNQCGWGLSAPTDLN